MEDDRNEPVRRISRHDVKMVIGGTAGMLALGIIALGALPGNSINWPAVIALSSIVTGSLGYSFFNNQPPGRK